LASSSCQRPYRFFDNFLVTPSAEVAQVALIAWAGEQ
jgi:hypothetical protein